MNFYASPEYLEAVGEIFFSDQRTCVVDVRIGDEVLRLLEVDGRVITSAPFLDYHEALHRSEVRAHVRVSRFAENVSRAVIELARWEPATFRGYDLAPFVEWSSFATFDEYKAMLMQRQGGLVKDRERRKRRLAEHVGELVFHADDAEDDVLERARQWKSRQLRETGQRDYFADPRTIEFFRLLRKRGVLTASTLRGGGRLLSTWIGFIHDAVWSGWVFAYDPELRKFSVGHHLLSAMLEESHRRKHSQFDFSTGAEDYKLLYATHGRLLGSIGRPPLLREIGSRVKHEAATRTPRLFAHARTVKRAIVARSSRGAT